MCFSDGTAVPPLVPQALGTRKNLSWWAMWGVCIASQELSDEAYFSLAFRVSFPWLLKRMRCVYFTGLLWERFNY